jgi:hypothetical protein
MKGGGEECNLAVLSAKRNRRDEKSPARSKGIGVSITNEVIASFPLTSCGALRATYFAISSVSYLKLGPIEACSRPG